MKTLVEKIKDVLTQENGAINRIIMIKKFDNNTLIAHWQYPIIGINALIFDKNN